MAEATAEKEPSQHETKSAAEPSGPKDDVNSAAGGGSVKIRSQTPENKLGAIDPSAPANTGITPGSAGEKE